jgi:hypothetical protein
VTFDYTLYELTDKNGELLWTLRKYRRCGKKIQLLIQTICTKNL